MNLKIYARVTVGTSLIVVWLLTALTGFIIWLAPTGPRSGRMPLLLEWTKHEWRELHFWVSIIAIIITLAHLVIDGKALVACARYLISRHRQDSAGM